MAELSHIEINVSDFRTSIKFYEQMAGVLGGQFILDSRGQYAFLRIGRLTLVLIEASQEYREAGFHRKRPGLNHLCFRVADKAAVDAFQSEFLVPRKIPILYGGAKFYPEYGRDYYAVYFEDPDRVKLEVAAFSVEEIGSFSVRPILSSDQPFTRQLLKQEWGGSRVVTRGQWHDADQLPGFVAEDRGKIIGVLTLNILGEDCEIVTLNSLSEYRGVGKSLMEAAKAYAKERGRCRLWLITTNDNMRAVRFYQRFGMDLVAVHRNTIEMSRKMKPSIPMIGNDQIPIRHEIELEMPL